ncbi:hypothetical protein BEWA_053330 [Theileria equi strain WA]|uniref:Uncharacterized protein n=1 Tax=Theileria equi strain WA TaxID=1537102 RepID=L1LDR3_THEEQ|nr:hypothetical protein BEWA_053330 [Theileria equi strain WA]EKX73278.1 hypothetical protein BEWA_053330 [Theileria equi strain WA]|eukprot:XP_004832730.1 hypothetical protein BEWA_053330 [Theileria equi strain WA]
MKITNSRQAIDYLSKQAEASDGFSKHMEVFRVLINDLIHPNGSSNGDSDDPVEDKNRQINNSDLLFNMKIKNFENALRNMKPEDRTLPYEYIRDLVKLSELYPTITSRESISRVLYLLLENEKNTMSVLEHEYEVFESSSLISTQEDQSGVLSYFYSVKLPTSSFISVFNENFPIVSIHSGCLKTIQKIAGKGIFHASDFKCAEYTLPQIKVPFVSRLWLKYRKEFTTFVYASEVSIGYSFFRNVFSPGVPGAPKFLKIQKVI